MRTGRRVLVGVLLFGAAGLAASPASAESRPPGDAGAYIEDGGNPVATARDPGQPTSGGSSGGESSCEWNVVIADDWQLTVYDERGGRQFSETGRWLASGCRNDLRDPGGAFLVPEGGLADPRQLAAEARQSVGILAPSIATSPDASRRLYVRVPTWLWVDEGWWQPYTATATAGRVSSTVTARPVKAEWSTGDGGGTTCAGPGVAWREGMREDATYCRHTYYHSSSRERGGAYTLGVTIEFEVTWTSNVGMSGRLAGLSRSASRRVEVGEIQAVESK